MNRKPLPRATELAHELIRQRVESGDTVADLTVGNGHDTLFLSKLAGENGEVVGFDIQQAAIDATAHRLGNAGNVKLHLACHSRFSEFVSTPVKAVMANLGYLPSADKAIITRGESSVTAIGAAAELLTPGGLITIVVYTGHEGGKEEAETVEEFTSTLDQSKFSVIRYGFTNQANHPPYLIAVEKKLEKR